MTVSSRRLRLLFLLCVFLLTVLGVKGIEYGRSTGPSPKQAMDQAVSIAHQQLSAEMSQIIFESGSSTAPSPTHTPTAALTYTVYPIDDQLQWAAIAYSKCSAARVFIDGC